MRGLAVVDWFIPDAVRARGPDAGRGWPWTPPPWPGRPPCGAPWSSSAGACRRWGWRPAGLLALLALVGLIRWTLGVQDEGIGVPPEHAEAIFQPFRRLGPAESAGPGIGLAVCRKTMERHGGRIWVESEPGGGAHFRSTPGE